MRTIIVALFVCACVYAEDFKPAEIELRNGSVVTGLVRSGDPIQSFNGAFTSTYSSDEVVKITFVDGEKAQAIRNEVATRQENRPRIDPPARKKPATEPVAVTQKPSTPATKVNHQPKLGVPRDGPSFQPHYPEGDMRNDPMAFITNNATLHVSYAEEKPEVRAEIRLIAMQIRTASLRSVSPDEIIRMDREKRRLIQEYFSYIVSNK